MAIRFYPIEATLTPSSNDIDWPAGEASMLCECGYESPLFCFNQTLYRCNACKFVDFPLPTPFLYEPPDCTRCGNRFLRNDRIKAAAMRPRYILSEKLDNDNADLVECPSCGHRTLALNSTGVQYMKGESDTLIPECGQQLHGLVMRMDGDLFLSSPRLSSRFCSNFEFEGASNGEIKNGHYEFRVLDVRVDAPMLTLQFVRRIPANEWL
ncbi:MAG: hypothetical protein KDB14_05820 [Planctomycetales bacterium]|nr:hypothetical protein [Planctomycetales bacterium]MCA9226605.1 hypothetical protein [Planctomycetales bacterium]